MGRWNHQIPPPSNTLYKAELATRLLTYAGEIGVTGQQLTDVTTIVRTWRQSYLTQGQTLVDKAHEIYLLFDTRVVDPAVARQKMDEYVDLYGQMIKDCMTATAQLSEALTDQQFAALKAIHDAEGAQIPFRKWP